MPVDAEIVAGGVWLRVVGTFEFESAVETCLSATELDGFAPGGRLLVDAREALPGAPRPEQIKRLVAEDVPRIVAAMPDLGFLTAQVDQWELGREVVRNSRELESVEFFSDLAAALRWLTDTQ